jgi:hypothetical protein
VGLVRDEMPWAVLYRRPDGWDFAGWADSEAEANTAAEQLPSHVTWKVECFSEFVEEKMTDD